MSVISAEFYQQDGVGSVLTSESYGTDMLSAHRSGDGYDDVMQGNIEVESGSIRYPGGAMSQYFDIENPYAEFSTRADSNGDYRPLYPLDEFLERASEGGASVDFVLMPDVLFEELALRKDASGNIVLSEADQALANQIQQQITNFVLNDLLQNPQGVVISSIELGNEGLNWVDGGFLSGLAAVAVQEAIDIFLAMGGSYDPHILLQFDPWYNTYSGPGGGNVPMINEWGELVTQTGGSGRDRAPTTSQEPVYDWFGQAISDGGHADTNMYEKMVFGLSQVDEALEAIDGLKMHNKYREDGLSGEYDSYYSNIDTRFAFVEEQYQSFLDEIESYGVDTSDFVLVETEFSIRQRDGDIDPITGLRSLPYIMEMLSEMYEIGVDATYMWQSRGDMPRARGETVYVDGALYLTMNQNLDRTQVVDLGLEVAGEELETTLADFHIFQNNGKYIIYAHNMTDEDMTFELDVSFLDNLNDLSIMTIGVAEGADPTSWGSDAIAELTTLLMELGEFEFVEGVITFTVSAYETAMIRIDLDGEFIGTELDDDIYGERGNDYISGLGGNDYISGLEGDDVISGGRGDDVIMGGVGDDQIYGNLGDDYIHGGDGDDALHGDQGDDVLIGSNGNDRLETSQGNDSLFGASGDDEFIFSGDSQSQSTAHGGSGADIFVFHGQSGGIVSDFTPHEDLIDISLWQLDELGELVFHENEMGTTLSYNDNTILLMGYYLDEGTAVADMFLWE